MIEKTKTVNFDPTLSWTQTPINLDLIERLLRQSKIKFKNRNKTQYINGMFQLMVNLKLNASLFLAFGANNPKKVSTKLLLRLIKALESIGAVEHQKGVKGKAMPILTASRQLSLILEKTTFSPSFETLMPDSLRIRDSNKNDVTAYFRGLDGLKLEMNQINQFNLGFKWTLDRKPLNPQMRRIFNESCTNLGGRLYGQFTFLPQPERAKIKINGKKTVEIDYSCIHLALIYAQGGRQIDLTQDNYSIEGWTRLEVKKAIVIIINCDSDRVKMARTLSKHLKINRIEAYRLISDIELRHPLLFQLKVRGLELQRDDSVIVLKVLKEIHSRDLPCISIHDSFITLASNSLILKEVMETIYYNYTGFIIKTN